MALHLNLLHEEISEHRQRQRDPLKLGMILLAFVGTLMVLFYMWKAYETLAIKSRLAAVQHQWKVVEPGVSAAQKRAAELKSIISTTKTLDATIDDRFLWARLLQTLARSVAPNAQLTDIAGSIGEDGKTVNVTVAGLAAGREPRADAEELRQLLSEQLNQSYSAAKVEFKTLEDLDTIANVGGTNVPMARFTILASFNPAPVAAKPAATPAARTSTK